MLESKMPKSEEVYKLPYGHSYSCPTCKEPPPDNETGYRRNKQKYPKCFNERKGYNGDDYWDWEEVHYCSKCKIEYYFTNGAY
jgi:biotin synthase-related radical SAM superfamily protein